MKYEKPELSTIELKDYVLTTGASGDTLVDIGTGGGTEEGGGDIDFGEGFGDLY